MVKSTYLSEKSSDFDETWYTASAIEPDDSHVTKIEIFIIQDGGGRHFENRFFGHNSTTDCPISAKFLWESKTACRQGLHDKNCKFLKIQDVGRPPFWKWLNRHISVKNRAILMKLATLHQILKPMTVTWAEIEIFKIQDGGRRHLKNGFFGHYSSTDCPISAKFCMRKQNGMLIRATGQKNANF